MRTITKTVYTFDELSDDAKDRARDWYREGAPDYDWWEDVYYDAEQIGLRITGFDLDRNRYAKGEMIEDAAECADRIIANHGAQCDTYTLAEEYLQHRDEIIASAEHDEDGELVDEYELDCQLDNLDAEFLHDLLEAYSWHLQEEYEWLLSDKSVDENILINKYTFTADGEREG